MQHGNRSSGTCLQNTAVSILCLTYWTFDLLGVMHIIRWSPFSCFYLFFAAAKSLTPTLPPPQTPWGHLGYRRGFLRIEPPVYITSYYIVLSNVYYHIPPLFNRFQSSDLIVEPTNCNSHFTWAEWYCSFIHNDHLFSMTVFNPHRQEKKYILGHFYRSINPSLASNEFSNYLAIIGDYFEGRGQ